MNVLEVRNLVTRFHTQDGLVHAVDGVSFEVREGELLGVVGESGSGKTATMLSLLQLLPMPPAEIVAGEALFKGQDLLRLNSEALRQVRGKEIGFIFQDPMTSLNPVLTVGFQIMESLRAHLGMRRGEARTRAVELLDRVGIPEPDNRLADYPHQFSGGMRQRVMIAIALACRPRLLIADEPTTALDVTIQAQVLTLIKELRREFGMSIIWITHDLGVMAGMADRVMVMYAGRIVERAHTRAVFCGPRHPYTRGLLGTLPRPDRDRPERLSGIGGQPPSLLGGISGCPFAARCRHAFDRCQREAPVLRRTSGGHEFACWGDGAGNAPRGSEAPP